MTNNEINVICENSHDTMEWLVVVKSVAGEPLNGKTSK